MKILTAAQMRNIDRRAVEQFGIPSIVLMENAAIAVADAIFEHYPQIARAAIFCGPGQNGGDGFAVARHLQNRGVVTNVVMLAEAGKGDAATNLEICRRSGIPITNVSDVATLDAALLLARDADVVIDAIFGSGLNRRAEGLFADAIGGLASVSRPVVAIDLPSGLDGSRTEALEPFVSADLTVTFAQPKIAHVFPPAAVYCGEVVVADIAIPQAAIDQESCNLSMITPDEIRPLFPPRLAGTHKGTYGHLAIIAGSEGKSGAAILAARGAVRAGAGLVTVVTDPRTAAIVDTVSIESMTFPLSATRDSLHALNQLLERVTAVAIGPGLAETNDGFEVVHHLVREIRLPLVIDASALNAFAKNIDALGSPHRVTVLTPHPGELARLLGCSNAEVQQDRTGSAREAARRSDCIVILKGHQTLIATPDGAVAVNNTGNPGMASGGMGDVLTGILGALLAQGFEPDDAARAAVYLHGLAADLLRDEKSEVGLRAMEVAEKLPEAVHKLRSAR